MLGRSRDFSTFSMIFGGSDMAESVKEIADRLFNANQPPATEPLPPREITLEEMMQYRKDSQSKLQNRDKSGRRKQTKGKDSEGSSNEPCPKCGKSNWDEFPDGRKYCLECGAVMELDGTVIGGAIRKEIETEGEDIMIERELKCEKCGKIQHVSATEKELNEFISQPHKNCGGKVSINIKNSKGIESKPITEAAKQGIKIIAVPEKSDRCDNPKRDIFICNNCRDFNYCSQKNIDAVICLLISIDLKLKKMQGR